MTISDNVIAVRLSMEIFQRHGEKVVLCKSRVVADKFRVITGHHRVQ